MKMNFHFVTVLGVAMALSGSALAQVKDGKSGQHGGQHGQGDGKGSQHGRILRSVDWDEFKQRCLTPDKFEDIQVQPREIKLECSETHTSWEPAAPGELNMLQESRVIRSGVISHKFEVRPEFAEIPVVAKFPHCPRFKEMIFSVTTDRYVTCADVLSFKGSLTDLCLAVVGQKKGQDKGIVTAHETGRMLDTCGYGAVQGVGKY